MITVEKYNVYKLTNLSNLENVTKVKDEMAAIPIKECRVKESNYIYECRDVPGNLFKVLDEGRFQNGAYYIMTTKENNFVASVGWHLYTYEDGREIALISRAIVHPTYRHLRALSNYLLNPIINSIRENCSNKIWVAFNEHNMPLLHYWQRQNRHQRYINDSASTSWQQLKNMVPNFNYIGIKNINYVDQHVVESIH